MTQPVPFGKYYLLERINVGGMAEVFKAKAFGVEGFERLVAVKRILPNIAEDEEFITMFIDEAKIAVQLQHANIAQIFDLGKVEDSYFIALEYVYGKDLRAIFDHLRKVSDRMPTAQVCYVMMQVCEGLDYAHNKRDAQGRDLNLVHRDVSPQNVLVGYEGEIKLVDFGIAKAAGKASKTQAGILKGKFGYMSPEQVRGLPVDRRSDVFAVGICLYELLTGERLFVGRERLFHAGEGAQRRDPAPLLLQQADRPRARAHRAQGAGQGGRGPLPERDRPARRPAGLPLFDRRVLLAQGPGRLDEEGLRRRAGRGERPQRPVGAARAADARRRCPSAGPPPEAARVRRPGALDWDDEELETQIFDRPGRTGARRARRRAELVRHPAAGRGARVPRRQDRHRPAPRRRRAGDADGLRHPVRPGQRLRRGPRQHLRRGGSTGAGRRTAAGPQRLPADRAATTRQPGRHRVDQPLGFRRRSASSGPTATRRQNPVSPFRQTIMGLPQLSPPPIRRPAGGAGRPFRDRRSAAVPGGARAFPWPPWSTARRAAGRRLRPLQPVLAAGPAGHRRDPGRRRGPAGRRGAAGPPPIELEKPPGPYNLAFSKEGYSKHEQTVQLKGGRARAGPGAPARPRPTPASS